MEEEQELERIRIQQKKNAEEEDERLAKRLAQEEEKRVREEEQKRIREEELRQIEIQKKKREEEERKNWEATLQLLKNEVKAESDQEVGMELEDPIFEY